MEAQRLVVSFTWWLGAFVSGGMEEEERALLLAGGRPSLGDEFSLWTVECVSPPPDNAKLIKLAFHD